MDRTLSIAYARAGQVAKLYAQVDKIDIILSTYSDLLRTLEDEHFEAAELQAIRQKLWNGERKASDSLKTLSRHIGALNQRFSLAGLILNILYLRDTRQAIALEQWKQRHREDTTRWLDALADADAYYSLGNFAFNHPDYTYPVIAEHYFQMQGKALGHPLLRRDVCVKNDVEMQGFRNAMTRDGVAMAKFLRWLRPAVEAGGQTEMSVSAKLEQLRAEQPLYRGLSFDTIAAYQEHGAIVHYEPTPETDAPLRPEGLLLLDSGAQYLDGTTDITRTIALGPLSDEQRRVYTLVLKAHIALELCRFPRGASGTQIDAIARACLWRYGFNFLHGTGHGVGSYLSVHEGPHQIRMEYKPAPLVEGMTVTDEPGLYLPSQFGVRTENTLLIVPGGETDFGRFLQFESLTLCPIDTEPLVRTMLTDEETAWLNAYHKAVYDRLSPHLDDDTRAWLAEACAPLK